MHATSRHTCRGRGQVRRGLDRTPEGQGPVRLHCVWAWKVCPDEMLHRRYLRMERDERGVPWA